MLATNNEDIDLI